MSSNTPTSQTTPSNVIPLGPAGTLRPVPNPSDELPGAQTRTEAEDKLWIALRDNPNTTAADLATARRAADLWAISDTHTATDSGLEAMEPTAEAEPADLTDTASAEVEVELAEAEATGGATQDVEPAQTGAAEGTPDERDRASTPGDSDGSGVTTGVADQAPRKEPRLAPGALRGQVEDFLRERPGEEFGPAAIAKALGGKASGAVNNALESWFRTGTPSRPSRLRSASRSPQPSRPRHGTAP
ncbi:MarR family transcriptional regulator [Goodfellowiella coeruleoviolacea]|uniref:Uncharacterized protein n=1 Tax=Goodfellowiella coeruleoviolacea TaxID=334858 RepID=A0AAE3KJW9_9PSEU|nr:MarR family transcriptional regulator [Goodfellowiella coeruleoviolacea]MCP2170090.1 hypothetical protein [Goodfellowiella coeruleoviolacea]